MSETNEVLEVGTQVYMIGEVIEQYWDKGTEGLLDMGWRYEVMITGEGSVEFGPDDHDLLFTSIEGIVEGRRKMLQANIERYQQSIQHMTEELVQLDENNDN